MFHKKLKFLSRLAQRFLAIDEQSELIMSSSMQAVLTSQFTHQALHSSESLVTKETVLQQELIVSLTTYSRRLYDVYLTIESLGSQTIKPNKIILWLDKDEFTDSDLPLLLKKQRERGLEIRFCENYRSYKKLLPTLKLFPNETIITVDDDVLYPVDLIESLVKDHIKHPNVIIANRTHKITFSNGKINKYNQWEHGVKCLEPSDTIVPIGVGGVLYPANCFYSDINNWSLIERLSPNADDIWFKIMALKNNFKCKQSSRTHDFINDFIYIRGSQDVSLTEMNVYNNGNDKQLDDVIRYYELNLAVSEVPSSRL